MVIKITHAHYFTDGHTEIVYHEECRYEISVIDNEFWFIRKFNFKSKKFLHFI